MTEKQYLAGITAGEVWARATGTTAADLPPEPPANVPGTGPGADYAAGFLAGVGKVRFERLRAEAHGYARPVTLDARYCIVWHDAHGEVHETMRHGSASATFIAALFTTPGCRFLRAVLA